MIPVTTIVLRLILAVVICGLIGLEREVHGKPVGFRTASLVGLGSALMTLAGIYFYYQFPASAVDPSRVASIVVSGIGFIGAGAIIQARGAIYGITTAASLWLVAGIGIALGMGLYLPAVIAGALALIILWALYIIDRRHLEKHKIKYPESKEEK